MQAMQQKKASSGGSTPRDTSRATIEIKGLSKRFGSVQAVDDLSFAVNAGKVTGFLGPNGAGKTTTLRMLLGLVRPDKGEATINGQRYKSLKNPTHHVGAVLEAASIHPGRSARNHLQLRALVGNIDRSRIDEVLEMVELSDAADRRVGTFSLGMKQRLNLAAALLGDPEIVILDEPTNGLDPGGVHWLRTFLRQLADQGHTVLVSSHLLAEVAQTVDDIVVLNRGRLVAQSSLQALLARAGTTNLEEVFFKLIDNANMKGGSR